MKMKREKKHMFYREKPTTYNNTSESMKFKKIIERE